MRLTQATRTALARLTCGGAPTYVWPGGGITFMVDVSRVPANGFGYVPTPALVAPIEFTLRLDDYARLGGHMDQVRPVSEFRGAGPHRRPVPHRAENPWPLARDAARAICQ